MPTEEDVEMPMMEKEEEEEEEETTEKNDNDNNDNDDNDATTMVQVVKHAAKATKKRAAKEKDTKTSTTGGGKKKKGNNNNKQSSTKAAESKKKKAPNANANKSSAVVAAGQLTLGAFFNSKKKSASSASTASAASSSLPAKENQSTMTASKEEDSTEKSSRDVVATSSTTATATTTTTAGATAAAVVVSTSAATKRRNELRDIALGLRLPSQNNSKKLKVQNAATEEDKDETETAPVSRDDDMNESSPKTPAALEASVITTNNKDKDKSTNFTTVTTATTTTTAATMGAVSTTKTTISSLSSPIPDTSSVKPGKLVHRFNQQEEQQKQADEKAVVASSKSSSSANDNDNDVEMQTDGAQVKQNDDDNACSDDAHDGDDKSSSSDDKQDRHEDHQSSSSPEEEEATATVQAASSLKCQQKSTDSTKAAEKAQDNEHLSEEAKTTLAKHEKMRERYCCRANEVLRQSQNLEEEEDEEPEFDIAADAAVVAPTDNANTVETGGGDGFPDFAVKHLAALVEGSKLPLSALTTLVTGKLNEIYNNNDKQEDDGGGGDGDSTSVSVYFEEEATAAQIKLLATRKSFIKNPSIASGMTTTTMTTATTAVSMDPASSGKKKDSAVTNIFEDDCQDCMWRWEVQIVDILPQESMAQIKKARAARKKVGTQFNALAKLLASLNEADKLIYENEKATSKSKSATKSKLDKLLARISQEEEKVLKYEREAEKARLSSQAKDMKKAAKEKKDREDQEKQKLKDKMAQEKERKKEESAREKELKKQEVAQKKEAAAEAKRKKQEQIEKVEAQKTAQLNKQRKCMQSFFTTKPASSKNAAAPDATTAAGVGGDSEPNATPAKVDNDAKDPNSSPITSISEVGHSTPSTTVDSYNKRKRKTKMVTVSVHVTPELSQGAWGAQAFAELQPVKVRNGFKFLRFHEDIRPAYHGTWSKKSSIVTGRTPFAKDTKFLNYDYDSEAEWEEGDDEVGEDIENDAGDEEEEKDDEEADDDDGWLAADDEFGDDPDEETIRLRKKMRTGGMSRPRNGENIVCIIAPSMGMPIVKRNVSECGAALVEGFGFQEGVELLYMHSTETVNVYSLYLDAFPPPFCEELGEVVASPSDGNKASGSKEMSIQDQQTFMRFVHNSSWGSKDKLVDEFRTAHPSITSSRALVVRTLESTADKKKRPSNGSIWEVKREILEKLELNDLADQAAIDPEDATKQILKEIATSVHHVTFSSKEKLADALLATQFSFSISRAELMRHLETMADKKKVAGGVYWEVKASVRDELGLTDKLSSSPPSLSSSSNDSAENPSTTEDETPAKGSGASKEEKTGKKSSGAGKKRKAADKSAGSSKLLASFLTKKP